jgi:hypothetical protein
MTTARRNPPMPAQQMRQPAVPPLAMVDALIEAQHDRPALAEAERYLRRMSAAAGRSDLAVLLAEYDRRGAEIDQFRDAGQVACEAAARIDAAFSHGVPSGSEDPVTSEDWHRLLRYARTRGTERVDGVGHP